MAKDIAANDVHQADPVYVIRRSGGIQDNQRLGNNAVQDGRMLLPWLTAGRSLIRSANVGELVAL